MTKLTFAKVIVKSYLTVEETKVVGARRKLIGRCVDGLTGSSILHARSLHIIY